MNGTTALPSPGRALTPRRRVIRSLVGALIIPFLCWIAMALACRLAGTTLFTGVSTLRLFVRGLTYVLLLSLGVSINMHTGRFDFATGAVMLLGGVTGALIAYGNGWGPWGMLMISIPTGAAAGCLSGLLYISLRLPPMIIGLGMTLVLEGVVAIITGGCRPVGFGTDASYYRFSVDLPAMLVLGCVALLLMILIFHFTRFGYDYRALQTGQRIAVNTGVRERANALGCYTLSGALFGAAGAVSLCSTNGVTPTINFSTIASMFACFLPLFFSGFIGKFCNKQLAILLGCVGYEFIQIGFGQLSFKLASFTSDVYKVIEAGILVLFLIYLNNEGLIVDTVTLRRFRDSRGRKETAA